MSKAKLENCAGAKFFKGDLKKRVKFHGRKKFKLIFFIYIAQRFSSLSKKKAGWTTRQLTSTSFKFILSHKIQPRHLVLWNDEGVVIPLKKFIDEESPFRTG